VVVDNAVDIRQHAYSGGVILCIHLEDSAANILKIKKS